jgi:hypothetical protein
MSARYSYAFFFQLKKKVSGSNQKRTGSSSLCITNEERKTLLCAAIEITDATFFCGLLGFACHAMAVIALVHAEYYTQSNWCISGDEI